jgi:peptide/nickel transport system substrate-binding protein
MRSLLLIVLAAAAACGEGDAPPGGVVVFGMPFAWQDAVLTPAEQSFGAGIVDILRGRLLQEDGEGGFEPALAESLVPDAARTRFTVTLRAGARFASGRPITAADVVASITAQAPRVFLEASALDERRLVLTLPAPRADLYALLVRIGVARRDQLDATGLSLDAIDASGAWTVVRARAPDAVLAPNPHYPAPPGIEGLVVRAFEGRRPLVAALIAGEIDHGHIGNFGLFREAALFREMPHLADIGATKVHVGQVRLNCASPRLADPRVRRALSLAVDRAGLSRRHLGRGAPRGDLPGEPAQHDAGAAMRLLDRSGWARGPDGVRARGGERLRLVTLVEQDESVADALQAVGADLGAVGAEVVFEHVTRAEAQARRHAGDFDLTWGFYQTPRGYEVASLIPYFRPSGIAGGLGFYSTRWDFGRCAGPLQPWVALADRAVTREETRAALAGLAAGAAMDPPALFIAEIALVEPFHARFATARRAPTLGLDASWWRRGISLRPGEALPRDRLSMWLDDR